MIDYYAVYENTIFNIIWKMLSEKRYQYYMVKMILSIKNSYILSR